MSMIEPFIRNHQYNFIKKQAGIIQHASKTVFDPNVIETVRFNAANKVVDLFASTTESQKQLLEELAVLEQEDEIQRFVSSLEPYMLRFPEVTVKQIKKLFSKNKKLVIPDLSKVDDRYVTYLGWQNIATNKLFIVYPWQGQIVGIEGKYTPSVKKSTCSLCNRHGEVVLFSAISRSRPVNAQPDYYKAVGNYICLDSLECNKNLTDVAPLERLIQSILG